MDKAPQDLLRQIVSRLDDIKRLIHDAVSLPREKHQSSAESQNRSANSEPPTTPQIAMRVTHLEPAVGQAEDTNQENTNAFPRLRGIKPLIDTVAVVFIVVYTGVTIALWCSSQQANRIARDTFNVTNRPYIGITGVNYVHEGVNAKGQRFTSSTRTPETTSLSFGIGIKNFGPVPGRNLGLDLKILLDEVEQPITNVANGRSITLFPTEETSLPQHLGTDNYLLVMNGKQTLEVELRLGYDGSAGHYTECERERWIPALNTFARLACK